MPTRVTRRRRDADEADEQPRRSTRRYTEDADDDDGPGDEDEPVSRSRRSRRRAEEEQDDPPKRSRRSSRDDDDDDDDDEPPASSRRSRRSRDDDEEDEPRRGRGGSRSRRSRDDDDDDDEPKGQKAKANGGWGSWKTAVKDSFVQRDFRIKEEDGEVVIKFLDDAPFHNYHQHWVDGLRSTNRKSFLCLRDLGQDCPLCDAGHEERRPYAAFNVIRLSEDSEPLLQVWQIGSGVMQKVEKKANAKATGPLTTHYYAVTVTVPRKSSSGRGGAPQYELDVVRERELDKYDLDALSDGDLDDFEEKAYDEGYYKYPAKSELRDIAREWAREDD